MINTQLRAKQEELTVDLLQGSGSNQRSSESLSEERPVYPFSGLVNYVLYGTTHHQRQ